MAKVNIMIIEDDAITAMDIENQLKNLGYGVSAIVSYGEEVIQKAKETTPDLVLMDIVLKGEMDGIEAAEKIRSQFDIPVIFLTAYADEERLKHATLTLPFGYVLKPFRKRELRIAIEIALYAAKIDSKRKKAEIRLKKSKERYRGIVEDQTELICRFRPDGTLSFVNESYCRYFRKNREELIGKKFMPLIPESDQKKVLENITSLNPNDPVMTHDHRVVNPKGDICWHSWTNRAIFDDQNNLLEYQAVGRDITERKRAEDDLKESENKYRSLVESTEDSVYMVDRNCRYLFMNKKYLSRFDSSKDKYMGRTYGEFHSEEATENFKERLNGVIETGKSLSYEYKSERDGRYFIRTLSPVKVPAGRETVVTVISKDITERKLTEEALQESEKKFRFLAENMVDIIWIVDQDFQTTYVSPSIEKTLGFTPEERKRQFLEEMITPKSLQKVQAKFIEELQRDEEGTVDPDRSVIIEVEYYHKEGYTVWMENVVKALRGPGGAIIGMHGVSRDINKRKQAEEALQESEIKHKTLVHNIPGMVYRAYTDWSAEIISGSREICGYTNEELNSQEESWLSIIYPDDKEKVFKEGLELTKRQQDAVQTYRIATKDGNIRWIEDRKSSLFSGEGEFKWIDGIAFDITARKQAEEALKEREVELARKNLRLEELNSALKVLLEKRNQDKTELEENVLTNMKELVLPYVEKLKRAGLSDKQEVFADILQSNLEDIVSPFARKLKSKYLGFTPTELKVSNLVRQGLSTKEIADLLNSSPETISGHRKSIRKKLKLTDKKSNLRTHLISLNNGRI
jgi:PAS domain S-box-containing protein